MKQRLQTFLCVFACLLAWQCCLSQDSTSVVSKITNFPNRLFARIDRKTEALKKDLDRQTEKYLQKLARQEARLQKKLYKLDSNASKNLFLSHPQQQYAAYIQQLRTDSSYDPKKMTGAYLPYADSLQGALSFLRQNPQMLSSGANEGQAGATLAQLQQLQAKMQNADEIQQFIQQRKEQIRQYLSQYTQVPPGIANIYQGYDQQLYYYSGQVQAYKDMLNDPDKLTAAALTLLDKLPAFTSFMQRNSMLASLFPVPGNYGTPLAISGLQTRSDIQQIFQSQLSSGPNAEAAFSGNVDAAQSQISQLKDKLMSYGSGGGNVDDPGFKPNNQKTRTFLKRLEYGANLQTIHDSYYFPTTTDLGLSLGYKMNDRNTIGIGASYKVGWGENISHIKVSGQGAGLRSFIDLQIKKTYYASGGLEYNYQQLYYSPAIYGNLSSWQQSGLIGLSKIISTSAKVFKKTKVQLLWDFLSYQQVPKTQPFLFRVGYNF